MSRSPSPSSHSGAKASPDRRQTRRVLNVPLLIGTGVVLVVLAPAVYGWWYVQSNRTADAFLERAEVLEKEGRLSAAAAYIHRYLKLNPDDLKTQVRLAETYDRAAEDLRGKARASEFYFEVLGKLAGAEDEPVSEERQLELRHRLAELLLEVGVVSSDHRVSAAREAWNLLQESDRKDPRAARVLALAVFQMIRGGTSEFELWSFLPPKDFNNKPDSVAQVFSEALKLNPGDVELSTTLAHIYRNLPRLLNVDESTLGEGPRADQADKIIDDMVAANPTETKARLARCAYRTQYEIPGAEEDLRAALRLGPEEMDVLLFAANFFRRQANSRDKGSEAYQQALEKAAKHYEAAVKLEPDNYRGYLGLGEVYATQGESDKAIDKWREGLEHCEEDDVEATLFLNLPLVELLTRQGQLDDAETALATLSGIFERLRPGQSSRIRQQAKTAEEMLRAKLLVARREHLEAIPLLKSVAMDQGTSDAAVEAWFLLGGCYAAANQWDQAATAFGRVAALKPDLVQAQLAAATAWSKAGDPSLAIPYLKRALSKQVATKDDTSDTRLALVQALLRHQTSLAREDRNWKECAAQLAELEKLKADGVVREPWRVDLLKAEYTLQSAGEDQREAAATDAASMLRAAEAANAESAAFCRAAVMAYQKLGRADDADRMLAKFEELAGEDGSAAVKLLQARLYTMRGEHDKARDVLKAAGDAAPEGLKPVFQLAQSEAERAGGDAKQSRDELIELYKKAPSSLPLAQELADRDLAAGNLVGEDGDDFRKWGVKQWEAKLEELEGPNGTTWRYFRAQRLLFSAKSTKDSVFEEAAELTAEVVAQRPTWNRAQTLAAIVADQRGETDRAIEGYETAIRLGERRLLAYERLVALLMQQGRKAEADKYLSQLGNYIDVSPRLSNLAFLSASQDEPDKAIELARRRVTQKPEDPQAHLMLATALLAAKKPEEAEAEYRKACELKPEDPRTWNSLFSFYVRTGQRERALDTLKQLANQVETTDAQKAYILAQGYQVLGHLGRANDKYSEAVRLAPDAAPIWFRYGAFLEQISPAEAEKAYRRVLQLAPESMIARRALGKLLVAQGGDRALQDALAVMDPKKFKDNERGVGMRFRAWLLNKIGGDKNLIEARRIYEELVADPKSLLESDRLALAALYEREGKANKARAQYLPLVAQDNPPASYVAMYAEFLFRNDFRDEGMKWLNKLEELEPDSLRSLAILLTYLHGIGQSDRARAVADPYINRALQKAATEQEKARVYIGAGMVFTAIEQHEEAERWYRRAYQIAPDKAYAGLANSLGQQGRIREAVQICIDAAKTDAGPQPAVLAASILTRAEAKAAPEDFEAAEPLLQDALKRHPADANLLFHVAGVRVVQGKNDEAVKLYEAVLQQAPKNSLVLNNLATLLAETEGRRSEALDYINEALSVAGNQSPLLDTKGMILVYEERFAEAIKCLEQAAAVRNPDPRYPFHLAVAYLRAGEVEKARRTFALVDPATLAKQILTEKDKQMLVELQQRFGQ